MNMPLAARPELGRSRARRLTCRTAVSALALAFGLTACATGQQTAQQAVPDKSATLMKIADETSAAGDPATAASLYRQLHTMKPQDPVPLGRLAATLMATGDYRGAIAAYRAALALDGKNEDYRRGIALALLAVGDAPGAMTEIRSALALKGDDPRLYNAMGVAQDMAGHHDLAQEAYGHGLTLAPRDAGLQNNFALSEALAGDYQGAVKSLSRIAGPDAPPRFQLNLALAYGLAGDDVHAAAVARGVLDDASVENNLAYYALLRGMDEAHRSAAIIATQLHGGVPQVAALSGTARGDAGPLAAATLPVAAAVLPAPNAAPQVEAKADLPLLPTGPSEAPRGGTTYAMKAPPPAPAPDPTPKTADAAPPAKAGAPQPVAAAAATAKQAPAPMPSPQSAAPEAAPQPSLAAAALLPAAPVAAPAAPAASVPTPASPDSDAPGTITKPIAAPFDPAFSPAIATPIAWPSDPASVAVSPAVVSSDAAPAPQPTTQDAASPSTPAAAAQPAPARADAERFTVQLGSFEYKETAQRVADYFAAKGVVVATTHSASPDGRQWIVVRSGEFDSTADAADALAMIRSMGLVEPILVRHYVAPAA